MTDTMRDYWDALQRLKENRPIHVAKGTPISKDAVSLEAGRQRGTIKPSRPQFGSLIQAIAEAVSDAKSKAAASPLREKVAQLDRARERIKTLEAERDAALAREVSLLLQLYETQKELSNIKGSPNVIGFPPTKKKVD